MTSSRFFAFFGLQLSLIAGCAFPACAQNGPTRDAGSMDGRVLFVDRVHGRMLLQTPHGRYDVVILPSTGIVERGEGFHTIADLRRGQRVQVFLSLRDGAYFAQVIRLHGAR